MSVNPSGRRRSWIDELSKSVGQHRAQQHADRAEPASETGGREVPDGCKWHEGYEPVSQFHQYTDCWCSECENFLVKAGSSLHPATTDAAELRAEVERLTKIAKSNRDGFEEYERKYYLEVNKTEDLTARAESAEADRDQLRAKLAELERERDEARKDAAAWKSEVEMYANAWKREVSGFIPPKTHLIDALVLATRELKKRHDEASARDQLAERVKVLEGACQRLLDLIDEAGSEAQYDRVFAQFEFDELRAALAAKGAENASEN